MTIDRAKLEEAIAFYRELEAGGEFTGNTRILLAAAEAHLASLPKPAWRVRLHRGNTFELYTRDSYAAVLELLRVPPKVPYDRIEIEKP